MSQEGDDMVDDMSEDTPDISDAGGGIWPGDVLYHRGEVGGSVQLHAVQGLRGLGS